MNGLVKECVQVIRFKTRWMVGGTQLRWLAWGAENGAKMAGDVGVHDAGLTPDGTGCGSRRDEPPK